MTPRTTQFLYGTARSDLRSNAPRVDLPVPGHYRRRLVKSGPYVPIKIEYSVARDPDTGEQLDRSPMWIAYLNGELVDVFSVWPECSGSPIDEAEYKFLLTVKEWAEANDPTAPEANPRRPIDLNELPTLF